MYGSDSSFAIYQLVGIAINAAIAYFVYKDASERGMNAVLWAVLTFLFCIIALPVYLITRKPKVDGGA